MAPYRRVLLCYDASAKVARYANELGIDLVVVGHHPTSPMKRWWNGERHARLIDTLSCAVLFEIVRS